MDMKLLYKLMNTLRQMRGHERWTRPQLEAHQAESLRHLREYAYARSPFYQRFHKGLFDRPLYELPVLNKATMMEYYDELVTDRSLHLNEVRAFAAQGEAGQSYRNQYWINATSGSSGYPGFFLFDQDEWISVLASFARSQEWSGVKINLTHRQKMATVASISPWHMSSQVAASVKSWLRPSLRLPASQPLPDLVQQLNEWQPEILVAYASMTGILAEEQLTGRLKISPRWVYSASEVLTAKMRQRAHEAWGDEPYNQYVSTEAASIAAEYRICRHMHFLEDLVITEIMDKNYHPVQPGEYGDKVLITTLFSRTQPLIRYELNDSIRASADTHSCGLPFAILETIQGRIEDTLQLPAINGGRVVVQPLVFNRVMDILPVGGWQVVQQADDGLVVLLTGTRNELPDEAIIGELDRSLGQAGVQPPYIKVQHVTAIPKTEAGKAPLIKAYSRT